MVVGQPGDPGPAMPAVAQEGGRARAVQGQLGAQVPVHQAGADPGDHGRRGRDEAGDSRCGWQEGGGEQGGRRKAERGRQGPVRVARPRSQGRAENEDNDADVVSFFNASVIRPDVRQGGQQVRGRRAQAERAERVVRPGAGAVGAGEEARGGQAGQGDQA